MKLFQRIFATFCAVIICAIFVASFSFWLVQNTIAENHFQQQRTIETTLLGSIVSAFNVRGEQGAREILVEWKDNPVAQNVYVHSTIPIPSWRTSNSTAGAKNICFSSAAGTTRKSSVRPARCLFPACNWRRFGMNSLF